MKKIAIRWLSALLLTLALLLTAASAADGEEALLGVWDSQLANGAAQLTLNADHTASLKVNSSTYNLTWTLSGQDLTLSQKGIPLQATYTVTSITMDFGSISLVFSKIAAAPTAVPTAAPTAAPTATPAPTAALGSEAAILGSWQADSATGLTLNADHTALFKAGSAIYSCTWTLSGESLTLSQNGIPLDATYTGSRITMALGGSTLTFTPIDDAAPTETPADALSSDEEEVVGFWENSRSRISAQLTLNADHTAELVVEDALYLFTWKLSDYSLSLSQDGVPLEATYTGRYILMSFNNQSLIFVKSIAIPEPIVEVFNYTATPESESRFVGTWRMTYILVDGQKNTGAVAGYRLNADHTVQNLVGGGLGQWEQIGNNAISLYVGDGSTRWTYTLNGNDLMVQVSDTVEYHYAKDE